MCPVSTQSQGREPSRGQALTRVVRGGGVTLSCHGDFMNHCLEIEREPISVMNRSPTELRRMGLRNVYDVRWRRIS